MHIGFLPHGTGSGRDAIEYLLGELDHKGVPRSEVRVLRGDPQVVGELIDSLRTVERYTSGIIAWAPEDDPSDDEIDQVLEQYERTAFAGLDRGQYAWSAVLHVDPIGSKHIHVVVPRVELSTGKAMNIAPPQWEAWAGPLRNYFNYRFGWARPDDPARRRVGAPDKTLPQRVEEKRAELTNLVVGRIVSGSITTRDGVLATLLEHGEINRNSRKYVSIRVPSFPKPIRLRGLPFEDVIDVAALRAAVARAAAPKRERAERRREAPDLAMAAFAWSALNQRVESRAKYNKGRYPAPAPAPAPAPVPAPVPEVAPDLASGTSAKSLDAVPTPPSDNTTFEPEEANRDRDRNPTLESAARAVREARDAANRVVSVARDAIERATRRVRAALFGVEQAARRSIATSQRIFRAGRALDDVAQRISAAVPAITVAIKSHPPEPRDGDARDAFRERGADFPHPPSHPSADLPTAILDNASAAPTRGPRPR